MTRPVRIERRVVEDGLRAWNGMAADLESAAGDAIARIERLHAVAPWGDDAAGREFLRAYQDGDGPGVLLTWVRNQVRTITDSGSAIQHAIDDTARADADAFRA